MMNAKQALEALRQGSERFASGRRLYPHQDEQRIRELVKEQNPFVTILSCSDSRIPPEHIFDAGLGDLFVVRVAGNVFGDMAIGTVEFGVEFLKTPVLLVLGHTHCGAIKAAIRDEDAHSFVADLINKVKRAIQVVHQNHPDMDHDTLVETAVRCNVLRSIEDLLRQSTIIRKRVKENNLMLIGAIYQLEDARIEWLGEHPMQEELIYIERN